MSQTQVDKFTTGPHEHELLWQVSCAYCGHCMMQKIWLDVPLDVGVQCSRCLQLLDTSPLGQAILDYWKARS